MSSEGSQTQKNMVLFYRIGKSTETVSRSVMPGAGEDGMGSDC